jgi:hypothetical protein
LFKSHDRNQEEASQAKTKGMAEQAAAGEWQQQAKKAAAGKKGSSSREQLGELPKYDANKKQQERLIIRIVKCSLPTQRKTPTASSLM